MNVVKCSNGHFFDSDTYQVCPHCGAPIGTNTPASRPEGKEKRKGLFGGHKTKERFEPQPVSYQPFPADPADGRMKGGASSFGDGSSSTVDMTPAPAPAEPQVEKKKEVTLDFWQTGSSASPAQTAAEDAPAQEEQGAHESVTTAEPSAPEAPPAERPAAQSVSLRDAVKQASASSEGKTMSYFSAVTGAMGETKDAAPCRQVDPVVGWLVCIQGAHFGESFHIGAGMNSIGRSDTNRIVLDRDPSVSREKHALITYEPKHRKFYVKPGDSSGLTYLNDEYITETKLISERDIIELGNSKFIFVPLCCDSFTWEDYIKG